MTDETLGASGLWLGTRTGAGGTATLTKSFFGRSPWLHGQQVKYDGRPSTQPILSYFPSILPSPCAILPTPFEAMLGLYIHF